MRSIDQIDQQLTAFENSESDPVSTVQGLLSLAEEVMMHWLSAHGKEATNDKKEGFRLLALHRQGCKGEPSFNACRETCREVVYHYNLVMMEPNHTDAAKRAFLMSLVTRHLYLFVTGKLEQAKLGEFCCSSKPLRNEAV